MIWLAKLKTKTSLTLCPYFVLKSLAIRKLALAWRHFSSAARDRRRTRARRDTPHKRSCVFLLYKRRRWTVARSCEFRDRSSYHCHCCTRSNCWIRGQKREPGFSNPSGCHFRLGFHLRRFRTVLETCRFHGRDYTQPVKITWRRPRSFSRLHMPRVSTEILLWNPLAATYSR